MVDARNWGIVYACSKVLVILGEFYVLIMLRHRYLESRLKSVR